MTVLLIAEDEQDIATILTRIFTRAGLTVLSAPDGEAALHLAETHHPDVVLTDIGMPKVDGWELVSALRRHPTLSLVPIAVLSGQLHHGDERAARAEVCTVLLKPCPKDELTRVIDRLIAHGPHPHPSAQLRSEPPEPTGPRFSCDPYG